MRKENPMIGLMQDWGGWLRTKKIGQGWGGSVDFENSGVPMRDNITHSDRTLSEVIATVADGQDVYQFIDRRVAEYYPVRRKMLVARYKDWKAWAVIADEIHITVDECEVIHRSMLGDLKKAICCGQIIWGRESAEYQRILCAA